MDRDINKIILVSLCGNFTGKVGKLLSQNLGMLFCDAKELVQYDLVDEQRIEQFCTVEYLEMLERKAFEHIASFENVIVAISYDDLIHNFQVLKDKSLIVFMKLSQNFVKSMKEEVNFLAYKDRTLNLEKSAALTIDVKKEDADLICEKIIEELGGIL